MKEWQIQGSIPDMKKVTEWAMRDPQRAAEIVVELSADYSGQQALRAVGTTWAQTDPEGGLSFAARLDPAARATLGGELIRRWAAKNPSAAAAYAASQTDLTYRAALGGGLVQTWALTDPTSALTWSQENLRGSARSEAVASVIGTVAQTDLTTASKIVADMEPGGIQNRACASIFEAWFNKGPGERNAAFEWLTSLPDQEARQMALSRVPWNSTFRDPDSLRDFLSGPYGEMAPDYVVQQAASMKAAQDPEEAMKWVSTLPGTRAATARMGVLANWVGQNPEQAQAYVLGMPASSERQQAVRMVSMNIASQSAQRAADWYRTLPAADRQAATQAFQQIGLDGFQRKALDDALKE